MNKFGDEKQLQIYILRYEYDSFGINIFGELVYKIDNGMYKIKEQRIFLYLV